MNLKKIFINFESFIFILSQILVGVLNYLFQIYASRTLTEVDFGVWSHWLAQFSVACFLGIWLQSLSVLGDIESYLGLQKSRWILGGIFLGLSASLLLELPVGAFIFGWLSYLLSGFWLGIHLRAKNMKLISIATIFGVCARFAWVFFDNRQDAFKNATLLAPFFVVLIFMIFSVSKDKAVHESKSQITLQLGMAALGLSFFSAWIPQVDLLMAPSLLTAPELGMLAKVGLLSKGCFFAFQILAQVLLAHQVQKKQVRFQKKHFMVLGVAGVGLSAVAVGASGFFGWPAMWLFLSLLHTTTLCLLFLGVQDLSARHRGTSALVLCVLLVIMAFSSSALNKGIEIYWLLMIVGEAGALLWLIFQEDAKQDLSRPEEYVTIKE